jgi:hypothetical protein
MPEIMIVLNDAEDRALHAGRVVTLPTHGAPFLHLTLAGKRIRIGEPSANGGPALAGASITRQRGDCPYCEKTDLLLAPHFKTAHPDKPSVWVGANPLKCRHCKGTFPTEKSRDTHERIRHKAARYAAKQSRGKSS